MADFDSFVQNILGVDDLVSSDTNKIRTRGDFSPEGKVGDEVDVLDLPMSDEKLLKLRNQWEQEYASYETAVAIPIRQRNLRSYLGRNAQGNIPGDDEVVAANLQFESEETFLPAATAQDPSPFVFAANDQQGNKLSQTVQTMLQFHAQQLKLRRKIAVMVRQWSINHLGVLKPGWNEDIKDVAIENRKIQDFIFDPEGYIDVYGDFSSWLGERIYVTAERLTELFPKKTADIILEVDGKMGTRVCYTEWWNDDYCFSTFKRIVLDKHKNEYFNYEKQEDQQPDELTGQVPQVKRNHFAIPKKPYIFLSVFSLQERPHDITGLIEQNIPNQRKITKRVEQIDNNVSQANNGLLFPEDAGWTQESAKQGYDALTKKGHGGVLVPKAEGSMNGRAAVERLDAPNFPQAAFDDLENSENHLRSSWGTQGIASQEQKPDETARGMTLNQGRDTSRIGGGIGDIIEQSVAVGCFDWLLQLYHVFYDEPHFGAVLGSGAATEYVELSAQDLNQQLIVGVTANSMQPKDQISEGNQAQTLFSEGAIGPKTLLETLSFPDPDDAAADGALWAYSKEADGGMSYITLNFPELAQKLQQMQQQQQQAQAQAQQQELQMQAAQGGQQLQQKAQAGQQQLKQGEASHQQKMRQEQESHKQKLELSKEQASAALAAKTKGTVHTNSKNK
jgi:hypothetical protein